jgi:hypothetical protein
MHGPLGIILMRLGIAEVDQQPIAEVLGNVPRKAFDHRRTRLVVGLNDVGIFFRVDLTRQDGCPHQVTKQDSQLPAGGLHGRGGGRALHRRGVRRLELLERLRALSCIPSRGRLGLDSGTCRCHRDNEAIAMAMEGLDNPLRVSIVTHGSPCGQNAVFNDRIADVLVRPQPLGEFLLWHHPVTVLEQVEQHPPGFRTQGVGHRATPDRTDVCIQFTVRKEGSHHPVLPH